MRNRSRALVDTRGEAAYHVSRQDVGLEGTDGPERAEATPELARQGNCKIRRPPEPAPKAAEGRRRLSDLAGREFL